MLCSASLAADLFQWSCYGLDRREHPRLLTVSGVLTLTMIYALFAPEAALQSNFGESLSGPVASIVVRNWGALIALVGGMLVYGARNPAVRRLVLTVAASSKIVFIALVLSQGGRFLSQQ